MAGFGKGLAFLREQQASVGTFGDRMKKLWLKEGDTARFWLLISPEDMPVPLCHMEKRTTKLGKEFNVDTMCARQTREEDPAVCPKCVKGRDGGFAGPFPRPVMPVWVDIIAHTENKPDSGWRVMGRGGEPRYVETVNAVWLWIPNSKLIEQLDDILAGDPMDATAVPPDPLRRCFRISVSGAQQKRVDVLTLEPENFMMPEAVAEARQNVPDLDKIIESEFGRKPGAKTLASGSAAVNGAQAGAASAHANETVPVEAYEPPANGNEPQEEIDF